MGTALTLIGALLPFVLSELQSFKAISPSLSALITGIEGAASTLISEITATAQQAPTAAPSVTVISLLAAINAAITVLQGQTTISPGGLAITKAFGVAVSAGLAASGITSVDPTKLAPIAPVA